jgi:hypothetical protein
MRTGRYYSEVVFYLVGAQGGSCEEEEEEEDDILMVSIALFVGNLVYLYVFGYTHVYTYLRDVTGPVSHIARDTGCCLNKHPDPPQSKFLSCLFGR